MNTTMQQKIEAAVAATIATAAITHPHLKVAEGAGPDPYLTDPDFTKVNGAELKVGDVLIVWWFPYRDTITKIEAYTGNHPDFVGMQVLRFTQPERYSFASNTTTHKRHSAA